MSFAYLNEAFKKLDALNEDVFSTDENGIQEMDELTSASPFDELAVIDPDADSDEDVKESYLNKAIVQCNICKSLIYKEPEEIVLDETAEDSEDVNVDEECPYCHCTNGFKIVGQVAAFEEVAEEEPDTDDGIVDTDVEEDEIIEESYLTELFDGKEKEFLTKKFIPATSKDVWASLKNHSINSSQSASIISAFSWLLGKGISAVASTQSGSGLEIHASSFKNVDDEVFEALKSCVENACSRFHTSIKSCLKKKVIKENNIDQIARAILGKDAQQKLISMDESYLREDINNIDIDTDDQHLHMDQDENGKVTVTTEPIENDFDGGFEDDEFSAEASDEMIAPPDEDMMADIESANTDEEEMTEEEAEEEAEEDVDIEDFDEESFDELGESYLREVYDNVESYETTDVEMPEEDKIKVEGLIRFTSGKTKKTSFIFEAKDIDRKGNIRFIGENKQICRGKKAFTVKGKMDNSKFLSESFTYNYRAKNSEGKSTRLYNTIRRK